MASQESIDEIEEMTDFFNLKKQKFFGGIYSALIADSELKRKGFIINKVKPVYSEFILPFLMIKTPKLDETKKYTGIVVCDATNENVEDVMDTINSKVQGNINYIGGGASIFNPNFSVDQLRDKKVLFSNDGFKRGGAYLCIVEEESKTEVKFGYELIAGPFSPKYENSRVIKELNRDNAFEVYRFNIENIANISITPKELLLYGGMYFFANVVDGVITKQLRPVMVDENGGIITYYSANRDEELYMIKADKDLFLEAVDSLTNSLTDFNEKSLVFSCISREMFLAEDFEMEIKTIDKKNLYKSEGALASGEYSNSNRNKRLTAYGGACIVSRLSI